MRLTESERGEAFEAMRRRQEMLRLDDHVPLPEWALQSDDGIVIGLFAAAGIATVMAVAAAVSLYGLRVVSGGG